MDITEQLSKIQRIPLEALRKLVNTLPIEEINKIPPEKLPENIPQELVDAAPQYSRPAIESLILSANSYHLQRRVEMQEKCGDELVSALDHSKLDSISANIKLFKNKITDLTSLREQQQGSEDHKHYQLLAQNCRHIDDLLMDVRSENSQLTRSIRLIRKQMETFPEFKFDLELALKRLIQNQEHIEHLLADYFVIRLDVNNVAMQSKMQTIFELETQYSELDGRINMMREDLDKSQAVWKRALQRGKSNQEGDKLQSQITELINEQKSLDIAINENDLTQWLDTIVDASLHPFAMKRVQKLLADARMALYNLLNRYCLSQEKGAMQLARNPFAQIDTEQAIQFLLLSEQFILDYFKKKRNLATAWISDVAEIRMGDLDMMEKSILAEFKRSSKLAK